MNAVYFALGFALALTMVYHRAFRRGYESGLTIGLALFKSKLPFETYQAICLERVSQINSLLEK